MTFRDDAEFNPDQVPSRGGGGGAMGMGPGIMLGGGGAVGLILLVLSLLLGGGGHSGLDQLNPGSHSGQLAPARPLDTSSCRTGADANHSVNCRILFTMQSLNDVWTAQLPTQAGKKYVPPNVSLYSGYVDTGCGQASSSVGPFYCPADHTAYFDSSFFQVLVTQFGSSGGPLAQEYVVAHEVGHAVQNMMGVLGRAQRDRQGASSAAVRTELQADCYAGIWAHFAAGTPGPGGGAPLLRPLSESDVRDALSAASSVGDDRIQSKTQGGVSPETWTHGSSEMRQHWFMAGYRSGQMSSCDTFQASDLSNPGN